MTTTENNSAPTVFSKIISKEIAAQILYEDDHCLAFRDIQPQAPCHFLMIPKKVIRSMNELTSQDQGLIGHMMLKIQDLTRALGIAESGYRIVINTNSFGGQSVYHLHFHVLGGRLLTWPPG